MKVEMELSLDGAQWCALIGPDLQEGTAGFGETPYDAVRELIGHFEAEGIELRGWTR